MASKFQNRLVGTIVLVSIGVIVLPDILDGQKVHYQEGVVSIPIKPELDSELESYEVVDPETSVEELPPSPVVLKSPEPKESNSEGPLEVAVQEQPDKVDFQESAWIIQLMALKNADNARNLVKDLQKRGYQAHVKPENGFTRVIIGPNVSKTKLEKQIVELEKITGSKGQLLKFKPINP